MEGFEELPAGAQIDPIPEGFEVLPDDAQLEPVGATEVGSEMQGGFADSQPRQPLTKLTPEDEAAYRGIVAKGSVAQIQSFLHSRGMQSDAAALQQFVDNRDKANQAGGKVNYDPTYAMSPVAVSSTSDAVARGFTQGATLGFGDELHGVAAGVGSALQGGSYSDAYNRTVDTDRANIGSDEENNYAASLAGNLAGGLLLPVGLERAGITASTRAVGVAARDAAIAEGLSASAANRVAARAVSHRLAAEGAAYGGAYGAGSSEGDPGERLLATGTGAVAGAVAGGVVLPALAKGAGYAKQGIRSALQPFTRSGAQDRAGGLLEQAALRPIEDILSDISGRASPASGALPTLGEVAGDAGLAGFQRGFANTEQRAGAQLGERNASNAIARTRYASDAFGDGSPQAVQDYAGSQVAAGEAATATQQAERAAAAEVRLAGERANAVAGLEAAEGGVNDAGQAVGPLVDRTATGVQAREAFEPAYEAAKARSREAYAAPALQNPQPIEIPSEVFAKDMRAAADDFYGDGGGEIPASVQSIINDAASPNATTRTLTNIDRRLADFAGQATMSGNRSDAAFANRLRGILGNFADRAAPQEYREALSAAKGVRAEQGRVFETGDAPKAFARDRYNNPAVGDTTVPGKLVRPGAPGGDTADGLIAAVGAESAETLVRQELRRAIEEGGVQSERAAQGLLTRFGEVAKRFPALQTDLEVLQSMAVQLDAAQSAATAAERATFTPAENAAIKERAAFHDTVLSSPLGKVADASTDPSAYVGQLLARKDDGRQLRFLARQVASNDNALNGFRRALGDYIETAGAGPGVTLAGENIPAIAKTRKAIDTIVKRAGSAITPQQKMALKAVQRELVAANFAASAGRPLGSDTAMNQGLARMIGRIPIGGAAKSVAIKIVSALGNENEVKRLLTQAILDPDFAATLLKRPTKQHLADAADRIAGRKGILPVTSTINAGTQRMTGTNQ